MVDPTLDLKRAITAKVCEQLEQESAAAIRAAESAHQAATHEEAKPENDKDTRSVEAAYLAGAQASRASDSQTMIARLRNLSFNAFPAGTPVQSGALLTLELLGQRSHTLMLPFGGGIVVELDGQRYRTTTPQSPLGAALIGAVQGETLEIETPAGLKEYLVVRTQ